MDRRFFPKVNAVPTLVRPGAVFAKDEVASLLVFEPSVYGRWPGSRAEYPAALRQRAQGNAVARDARPCLGVAWSKGGQRAHLAEAALKAFLRASSAGNRLLRQPVTKWRSADDVGSSGAMGKPVLVRLQPKEGNTASEMRQPRGTGILMWFTTTSQRSAVQHMRQFQHGWAELGVALPRNGSGIHPHKMIHLVGGTLQGPVLAFPMWAKGQIWQELIGMCANPAMPAATITRMWRASKPCRSHGHLWHAKFNRQESAGLRRQVDIPERQGFREVNSSVGNGFKSCVLEEKDPLAVPDLLLKNLELVKMCPASRKESGTCEDVPSWQERDPLSSTP
eukprot:jgi/Botrbrau1/14511/Bobra.0223s0001.1